MGIDQCQNNFRAYLVEDGEIVPGSLRLGHNVLTDTGGAWLAQLVAWSTLGAADVHDDPFTDARLRWISVGKNAWMEHPSVSAMADPVIVSGSDYLAPLDEAGNTTRTQPVSTALKYVHEFQNAELADLITNPAMEAALFADYYPSGGPASLDPTLTTHAPVAYKRIDPPLLKSGSQKLYIEWELRF